MNIFYTGNNTCMQIYILPFRIRKKTKKKYINEKHNRNLNSPILPLVWISKKIPESQNIRLHTPPLPSFLLPIIQYLRGARRYSRRSIISDRYIGQLFPRGSPLPLPSSCRRSAHASSIDTTRHEWRPRHSINRTKTNNVRHACEL